MASHEGDQASLRSSIALLQERFRQLQRIREMRQERELLQYVITTSEPHHHRHHHSTNPKSNMHYDNQSSTSLFSNSEMIFQQRIRPSSQLELSLWRPEPQMMMMKKLESFGGEILDQATRGTTTAKSSSRLIGTTLGHNNSVVKFDHHDPCSDVDTSLHL